ncbi:hypothetical protein [Nostoc sp. PCC 7524]|uniref:hypothetical protein n=1 Tax=Nostoc sp. (strain ATCC 29411 / PCC 7524) TaxID=28072 RepID=UPI000A49795A|nr:hypothetical protein [Nostoc sp. PCC 7524]
MLIKVCSQDFSPSFLAIAFSHSAIAIFHNNCLKTQAINSLHLLRSLSSIRDLLK